MSSTPAALESVLSTDELKNRPSRPPDYEAENAALLSLAQHLADSPQTILQKLAELAMDICRAGSAGVSLISEETGNFYWPAIAGAWKPHIGGGTPRNFGPCGVVLDRNAMQLFKHPERCYPYLRPVSPPLEEVLLTPFYVEGKAVGTVWVVAHDPARQFDAEDLRQIESLGRFAAAAHQVWTALASQTKQDRAMRAMNEALLVSSVRQHELTEQANSATASMHESEARFRMLADNMDQLAWTCDQFGNVTWYNQRWLDYTGMPFDEMKGWDWSKVQHPDHVDRVVKRVQRSAETGEVWEDTFPLRGKDGQYRWFLSRAVPIRDDSGEIAHWFGTNTDVTEQRAAENAVLRSEVRYRRLFEMAHDGILILDPDSRRITEVNPFLLDLLDYPREYFIGKELWEIGLFRNKVESQQAMNEVNENGSIRFENKPMQDRNGRRHAVEIVANKYQEDIYSVIQCNIRDISERARFESERSALLANEQASRLEAEAANRAKDTFLATLSHELRTPLTAILGWAVLLRSKPGDEAAVNAASYVIERNAKVQTQLIEDVLDVSRIVSGKLRLEMKSCDLSKIIEDAVASVQPAADAKDIDIRVEIIIGAGPLVCDAGRIQQVIWNLLSNAIKFSPKVGDIDVLVERVNSMTRISITDSGEGISPDFLPHVFERFRQSDGSSTRQHGGLGLGLNIVKHLIELHGGTVAVESEGLGHGATFIINLPIRAVASAPAAGGGDETVAPTTNIAAVGSHVLVRLDGLRVLIVDDEPDARNVIQQSLKLAGAIVAAADSAAAALKLLAGVKPHVIVSDISMPAMDGYELMKQIRSIGDGYGARDLPAIALTAYARVEDRRRALLAGFQMHVAKPVDPNELTEVVASLAGRTGLD